MMSKFGAMLKELREERKLSQKQLAEVLNTTKYTISAWELSKQETDFDTLIEIAQFFEVTTDYLLGLED